MKVYKYPLKDMRGDVATVSLPLGAQLLRVDEQYRQFTLWALVDEVCSVFEDRRIRIAGTGHLIAESNIRHINSFLMEGGRLVFHAFEVIA